MINERFRIMRAGADSGSVWLTYSPAADAGIIYGGIAEEDAKQFNYTSQGDELHIGDIVVRGNKRFRITLVQEYENDIPSTQGRMIAST